MPMVLTHREAKTVWLSSVLTRTHNSVMALGPLHTEINSISVSTKSKGTSSAESTYQTDVR